MADSVRGRRTGWWRRVAVWLGALSIAIVGGALLVVVYLLVADLGRHRCRIETLLSGTLGYDVSIGELHVDRGGGRHRRAVAARQGDVGPRDRGEKGVQESDQAGEQTAGGRRALAAPVVAHLDRLDGDQAALQDAVDDRQERLDTLFRIDDLDHDREVAGQSQ